MATDQQCRRKSYRTYALKLTRILSTYFYKKLLNVSDLPTILTDIMKKDREKDAGSVRRKWVISITIFAFLLSVFMSLFSETVLRNSTLITAFIVLIVIVLMGVVFDIIGVAVTVAEDKPFHSMAAGKIKGARSSLRLIKNASRVSNVCNDVMSDTCDTH